MRERERERERENKLLSGFLGTYFLQDFSDPFHFIKKQSFRAILVWYFSVELFAALIAHAPSANLANLELYNSDL
jgi:hypothetical protein